MKLLLFISTFLLVLSSSSQSFDWAKSFGNNRSNVTYQSAVDDTGNVFSTGFFFETVDFDPGQGIRNLTAVSPANRLIRDIFIQKLDPNGNFLWAYSFGDINEDIGRSIGTDSLGNVYVVGTFSGTVDFDPGPGVFNFVQSPFTSFILKLDPSGNFVWAKRFQSSVTRTLIEVDRVGNLYITGIFSTINDFDFGPGVASVTPNSTGGQADMFILKLDWSGTFKWVKTFEGNSWEYPYSIFVDAKQNVYSTGTFFGTLDLDPSTNTNNQTAVGQRDVFIFKLDSSGNYKWGKTFGGSDYEEGSSIHADQLGNVYSTGFYKSTVDFDPGPGIFNMTSNGQNDIYILKLDSIGNFVWVKNIGGTRNDFLSTQAIDQFGNIYTGGLFQDTVDFDPNQGTFFLSANSGSLFIQKIDTAGNFVWAINCDGHPEHVEIGPNNEIVISGTHDGISDFDPGPATYNLTSNGSTDHFVMKLNQLITYTKVIPAKNSQFLLYPNPTSDHFNIEVEKINKALNIRIINAFGQTELNSRVNSERIFRINFNLDPGIYLALVELENGEFLTKKFIVNK